MLLKINTTKLAPYMVKVKVTSRSKLEILPFSNTRGVFLKNTPKWFSNAYQNLPNLPCHAPYFHYME